MMPVLNLDRLLEPEIGMAAGRSHVPTIDHTGAWQAGRRRRPSAFA